MSGELAKRAREMMREAVRGDFMLHSVQQRVSNKTKPKPLSCNKAMMSQWLIFTTDVWQVACREGLESSLDSFPCFFFFFPCA